MRFATKAGYISDISLKINGTNGISQELKKLHILQKSNKHKIPQHLLNINLKNLQILHRLWVEPETQTCWSTIIPIQNTRQ